jgi:glycosyltransferase involved in cell wall biosynthesis
MFKVSVVIATCNRVNMLSKALLSILSQKTDQIMFEVLVVDNNSKDKTREVVESLSEYSPVLLRYSFEPSQGKAFALNRGIREAQGEIIVFSDDDIVADPYWLMNLVHCFDIYDCDSVGGRVLPDYPENTPVWIKNNAKLLSGPIVSYDYGTEVKKYQDKVMYEFLGANVAFKKSVFAEVGNFRTDLGPGQTLMGEDTEIVARLIKARKKLYYCGTALVWHPVDSKRMSLFYIAKWNMGLGYCRVITDQASRPIGLKYLFGYPRYLIKIIIKQIGLLCLHVQNKREFLSIWIDLFVNIGKARQLRRYHLQKRKEVVNHETFSQRSHLHV